jgi:hypothetical protein
MPAKKKVVRKKTVVRLNHKAFGECVVKEACYTDSSGSAYFTVLCEKGEKQLLAAPEYWSNTPDEVNAAFRSSSQAAIAAHKATRAAERKKDLYDGLSKNIAGSTKLRLIASDEAEVAELEEESELNEGKYQHESDEREFVAAD